MAIELNEEELRKLLIAQQKNVVFWKQKHKEYGQLCQEIRNTNYYIQRQANV